MVGFVTDLFDTTGFPPRWRCGTWSESLGWTHIVSDLAIFGAYVAIPAVLAFFILRRKDIPFPAVMWLFVSFIFACGSTHLIEAIIFWSPIYRFAGFVKAFTAIVSWGTVIALIKIVPQVLHFPGLAKLNSELQTEVDVRRRVEDELRSSEEKLAGLLESERAARADAERANRVKDDFLSTVSHELRTPLNSILGYAQLLMMDGRGEPNNEVAVIERNARAQAKIIDELLDMSRIISGKVRLDVEAVDLVKVVNDSIDTVRPGANAKNLQIQAVLDPNAAQVWGDSARLQQVTWNLLSNAVKFTPKNQRIQVSLQRVGTHIALTVSDTGEGIPPESLPLIFDRFQQAETGTTRRHGGLGLGLSIAKHLVELHGGSISAASDGLGRGATFTVKLPVRVVQNVPPSTTNEAGRDAQLAQPCNLTGVRVLVVDDEADTRELVKRLLEDCGADVQTADSVAEALRKFRGAPPDVLLSDIGMPHRDGYDLARAIRSLPEDQGGRVPAIAVTAFARTEDRKRAMLAGFQAHIAKPVDAGELAIVVATLAGRTG